MTISQNINIDEIGEALNNKMDNDFGNAQYSSSTYSEWRRKTLEIDYENIINVTATTNDNVSYYTAPMDGIFVGLSYGGGSFAINGIRLTVDTSTNNERRSFLWFPLNKGDVVTYWGGNWYGAGTQRFFPFKYQLS